MTARTSIPAAPGDVCISTNTPLRVACTGKVRVRRGNGPEVLWCPKCKTEYGVYLEA